MNRVCTFERLKALCSTAVMIAISGIICSGPASAAGGGNCLKDLYGKNVTCTANDVRIAFADNPRDLKGNPLTQCTQGSHFDFVADFHVTTTATSRENIGLYFQTAGGGNALTGTCSDNIIAPPHSSSNSLDTVSLGSAQYEELDSSVAGDTCGDISTSDNNQVVTVEVDNVLCQAGTNGLLALPNCTSWQQPGGVISCQSPQPYWPWVSGAIPGSPSKCNCESGFTVPIVVAANLSISKTCSVAGQTNQTSCSMTDPGGTVTYTLTLNNSGGSATVNQICDSAYGNIATAVTNPAQSACPSGTTGSPSSTTCSLPRTIGTGGSYSCTFTAVQAEDTSVTDVATANGVGS